MARSKYLFFCLPCTCSASLQPCRPKGHFQSHLAWVSTGPAASTQQQQTRSPQKPPQRDWRGALSTTTTTLLNGPRVA
ncbi:hypothetical protein PR003_g28968 [Phytophthora rubi]|uniref:Uncharacterized protein n=1 Tax=Phytophthora rubi TaxID=129364 RepID=A0A6A4BRT3_9STRA|nr:hypothetical protein PR003_g28968 [Phytophthora rubi]